MNTQTEQPAQIENEQETMGRTKVSLGTQGPVLPLGSVGDDGKLHKDMDIKRWKMKEEKELGKLTSEHQGLNLAQHVNLVVAFMFNRLGHYNFESTEMMEKRVINSQMFMGDIYYAYMYLRKHAISSKLKVTIRCPCNHEFPFIADLDTTDVYTANSLEDAVWEYELKEPFKCRGDTVKKLIMGPQRWNALEMLPPDSDINTGIAKFLMIQGSIQGINDGAPALLSEQELDEMDKVDIEGIVEAMEDHYIGPDMALTANCTKCKRRIRTAIDWRYEAFFASSSQ